MTAPYTDFERDVPEHLREDAMQMMAEATGGYGEHPTVYILERDRIDAINCRAHGIINIDGTEYTFQMEDGNRNGTELLAWDSDRPFVQHEPVKWALQPQESLIGKAIMDGRGPFLIIKWDAMLQRPQVSEIPGKYSYDRYFAPGLKTETFWRARAAEYFFTIVTEETASETRAALSKATGTQP